MSSLKRPIRDNLALGRQYHYKSCFKQRTTICTVLSKFILVVRKEGCSSRDINPMKTSTLSACISLESVVGNPNRKKMHIFGFVGIFEYIC